MSNTSYNVMFVQVKVNHGSFAKVVLSPAAAALVTMRPTILCSPTTANNAPSAAVRCRARRLASMAARAGSLGWIHDDPCGWQQKMARPKDCLESWESG